MNSTGKRDPSHDIGSFIKYRRKLCPGILFKANASVRKISSMSFEKVYRQRHKAVSQCITTETVAGMCEVRAHSSFSKKRALSKRKLAEDAGS